ncbi:MAG: histidinol-phosphatase HisJ family protein [Butyrivibrio sp.]|nr:histidinol-phosphatase HisJ family protein [Butyrivibrio sp.]
MILPADYHLHTHNSGDSEAPMEEMIESALKKGIKEICFTEHMDMDYPVTEDLTKDYFLLDTASYKKELYKYKEMYRDKITIKFGVEVGMQTHLAKKNSDYVRSEDFDFVIASIHLIDGEDPYYPSFWTGKDVKKTFGQYFEYTLENLKIFDDYCVLGHLDYLVRYAPKNNKDYSYQAYSEIIDAILTHLISKDKGLDFNTKPLYTDKSCPNPNTEILKRYKELGGRIITFGSDAHKADAVAGSFNKARMMALACGFDEYCTFEKKIPIFHRL